MAILKAARAHGRPMMVIAMMTPAIAQPTAIHRPPKAIHSRLSRREKVDMSFSRESRTMVPHGNGEDLCTEAPVRQPYRCQLPQVADGQRCVGWAKRSVVDE